MEKLNKCCESIKSKYEKMTTKQKVISVSIISGLLGLIIGRLTKRK